MGHVGGLTAAALRLSIVFPKLSHLSVIFTGATKLSPRLPFVSYVLSGPTDSDELPLPIGQFDVSSCGEIPERARENIQDARPRLPRDEPGHGTAILGGKRAHQSRACSQARPGYGLAQPPGSRVHGHRSQHLYDVLQKDLRDLEGFAIDIGKSLGPLE